MSSIQELSIDLETFSDVDIKKSGVYRYCESDQFEILLFAVSINQGPVEVYDLASGDELPGEILDALTDDSVKKWAFNASFERICLSQYLRRHYPDRFIGYGDPEDTVGNYLNPAAWYCSMVWSAYMGLPLSLEGVGAILGLKDQKMKEGKDLIRYFCVPCKPTMKNGGRIRNLPYHDSEKWALFRSYNKRDVEVELAIKNRMAKFPVPSFVWNEYHLDQKINDRGIRIDRQLVENAIAFDERSRKEISSQMKAITDLENPNSVLQMKQWLCENGLETETLGKKAVAEMIKTAPPNLTQLLTLRQKLAKSSIRKYQAMQNAVCRDGRDHMEDLSQARQLVRQGDYDSLEILYDDIPDTLSQLVRTAFIPKPEYLFYVADFSAIEARVLAHLAGETWRSDVFRNNGDIYCASASAMFHVPVVKHGINGHLRQKGKIAELALGYGGSVGALKAMGALEIGLSEEELQPLVNAWRESNPNIVQLWWDIDNAVKTVVKFHTRIETHGIKFGWKSGMLFIHLPSGRNLSYVKPRIGENKFGGESVTYEGIGTAKKWERLESYGPKLTENIVQAISRDLLMNAMKTLSDCYICGHVHDELIIECRSDVSLDTLCERMATVPDWLPGILLRAEGYITPWYRKD